jgi:aromatic-L-amino-acid decarboxylase
MAPTKDQTLDPQSEGQWAALRRAAVRLIDHAIDEHRAIADTPCYRQPPESVRTGLRQMPSDQGMDIEAVVERALELIAPYGLGNRSPRFWGWVVGAGNLPGLLGQLLANSMNSNVFAGDQTPVLLEREVLRWFCKWFGFPDTASGLLVDGASMANILGLAVARHKATDGQVRELGAEACARLRMYCSSATHVSIFKAAELLGLGTRAVRVIDAAPDGRLAPSALSAAIEADVSDGLVPFCIIANAGTVGVGAIDPIEEIHTIGRRHGAWLHVDGAVGATAALSRTLHPRLAGLALADSLAFDLHKWAQVQFDTACLLVRDGNIHRAAFETPTPYLNTLSGGVTPHQSFAFTSYGPMVGRRDRALGIWMTFMTLGTDRIATVFEQNVRHAQFLADCIRKEPELQLLNEVALNIVCFRFRAPTQEGRSADDFQEQIIVELQESGFCVITPFRIDGRVCMRVSFANHRTRIQDVTDFVARLVEIGQRRRAALLAQENSGLSYSFA